MYKFYAITIGVLITIMVTLNGTLDAYLGPYLSVLVIHIVGLLAVSGIFIIKRLKPTFIKGVPLYLYSGGAIGILLVLANNISFAGLGASLTLALGVFGQLILSSVIDHYGLMNMDIYKFRREKIVGFGIILIGIIIMTIY